jgi:hypothetical protein
MSLDVYIEKYCDKCKHREILFSANITHNLNKMAKEAGIYEILWHPEKKIKKAGQMIKPLTVGLEKMKGDPKHYKTFDSPNGWGLYEDFVPWIEKYLDACKMYPDEQVRVWI